MKKIVFTLAVMSFLGCHYSKQNGVSTLTGGDSNTGLSLDQTVNFTNLKLSSLNSCASCHKSGSARVPLEVLSDYQKQLSTVSSKVDSKAMPPSSVHVMSQCELDMFDLWVSRGAPEETNVKLSEIASCATAGPIQPVPNIPLSEKPLTYATVKAEILAKKCMVCHDPGSSDPDAQDMLFYPYSEIQKNKSWFQKPGATSKIVKITSSQYGAAPKMPEPGAGIDPLTPEEIQFLTKWIDAGLPQ